MSRGVNISECKSPWTSRSYPNYAVVSVLAALKKMHFIGYLKVLFFQMTLCFSDY